MSENKTLNFSNRSGFRVASGILAVMASCICIILGLVVMNVVITYGYRYYEFNYSFLFMGMLGIFAFALGLTGAITAFKKRYFALSIVGMCFLVIQSFVTMGAFFFV